MVHTPLPFDGARHAGRGAIVTGAASGIGRAAVRRFLAEGATVVACDVDADRLESLAARSPERSDALTTVVVDLTDPDAAPRVVETAVANGGVDILANVAGVMDYFVPVGDVLDDEWSRIFDINVTSVMRLCRAAIPMMEARGGGVIVNVASLAGLSGSSAGAAYTASKHALIGLTRNIGAMYFERGIRCNAVCPGRVRTKIGQASTPRVEWVAEWLQRRRGPGERPIAEPDEVAGIISWLASSEAANMSGAVVVADRGLTTFS